MRSSSLLLVAMVITVLSTVRLVQTESIPSTCDIPLHCPKDQVVYKGVGGRCWCGIPPSTCDIPFLCPKDQIKYKGVDGHCWCGPKCPDGQLPNGEGGECVAPLPTNPPPKDCPWYKWC